MVDIAFALDIPIIYSPAMTLVAIALGMFFLYWFLKFLISLITGG